MTSDAYSYSLSPVVATALDVGAIYRTHGRPVWRYLHRLGVREADVPDMLHEVFVVVHRRLHTYDRETRLSTWLFGIAYRVAAGYRRRAHQVREEIVPHPGEENRSSDSPERALEVQAARRRLEHLLSQLTIEKRAVFVMYELEELDGEEIAAALDIPVGTVYSRLHHARAAFARHLAALAAREETR